MKQRISHACAFLALWAGAAVLVWTIWQAGGALNSFAVAHAAQEPGGRAIPGCEEGEECEGHESQPQWCQNSDGGGYKANCACKRDCAQQSYHPETGCLTYCRTPRCHCHHGCETMR